MTPLAAILLAITPPGALDQAGAALDAQVAAWNRGDLEGALAGYCNRPDITWINRSGLTRGFADFAAGMRADFTAPASMGRYEVERLDTRQLGPEAALVTIRWAIMRDGRRVMGGISSQLWQPCDGRYRIVLEHAS